MHETVLILRHWALSYSGQCLVPRSWAALPPAGVRCYNNLRIWTIAASYSELKFKHMLAYLTGLDDIGHITQEWAYLQRHWTFISLISLCYRCSVLQRRRHTCSVVYSLSIKWWTGDMVNWNNVCKASADLWEQDWRKLRNIIRLFLLFQNLLNIFLISKTSGSEDSTVLLVVLCIFLWEDLQFIKNKRENHWHCNITAAASALMQIIMHTSLRV